MIWSPFYRYILFFNIIYLYSQKNQVQFLFFLKKIYFFWKVQDRSGRGRFSFQPNDKNTAVKSPSSCLMPGSSHFSVLVECFFINSWIWFLRFFPPTWYRREARQRTEYSDAVPWRNINCLEKPSKCKRNRGTSGRPGNPYHLAERMEIHPTPYRIILARPLNDDGERMRPFQIFQPKEKIPLQRCYGWVMIIFALFQP